jgi:integrase/recombinase XerD
MDFASALNGYLNYLGVRRFQEKTISQQRIRLTVLKNFVENCEIEKITPETLQKFFESSYLQQLARGTYNHYISNAKTMFTYCHAMGWIKENPSRLLEFVREEDKIIEYLTIDEVKKLLKVKYPYGRHAWKLQLRDQLIFRLAIFCGLRSSEIRNLRWVDVEWSQKEIFVRKGKNLKDRIVPISNKKLYNWLKAAYHCRRGVPYMGHCRDEEYVVQGCKGKPINHEIMNDTLRRNLEYAGIKKKWPRTHMLRHTSATMYLRGRSNQRGMDIRLVAELLGHANLKTTMRYAHVDKDHLRQEMQRANPMRAT